MKWLSRILFWITVCIGAAWLFLLSAHGAERITLTLTVTNVPVTGNSLTINSDVRYWTNAQSSTTFLTNLAGVSLSTTNMANQMQSFRYTGPLIFEWAGTNSIRLIGQFGQALSAVAAGSWASISLSTQSGPSTFTFLWPMQNMAGSLTNRTNQASSGIYGLGIYSTNAFPTNSTATSNYLTKGASPLQRVDGPVQFGGTLGSAYSQLTNANLVNATNRGYVEALTNGYWTNAVLDAATGTNLTVYGGLNSYGSGGSSTFLAGPSSRALSNFSIAIGNQAQADATTTLAIGYQARARAPSAISIGTGPNDGTNSITIGGSIGTNRNNVIMIGVGFEDVLHDDVIGIGAEPTTNKQVVIGASTWQTRVPGNLQVEGKITNSTFTGTNILSGDWSYTSSAISSIANGHNTINVGTNVYVRLTGSPSAAWTLGAITGGNRDGKFLWVENVTGQDVTIQNESGTEPTAANRILTYAGIGGVTNVTITGNGMLGFIYSGTASRWVLITPFGDITAQVTNSLATNTANFTITTNDFSINTYYTNSAQRSFVFATIAMTNVLAADVSRVALYLDQDADGTWEKTGIECRLNGLALLAGAEELSAAIQPSGRFIFTNLSTGGGTSTINANSSQWVRE